MRITSLRNVSKKGQDFIFRKMQQNRRLSTCDQSNAVLPKKRIRDLKQTYTNVCIIFGNSKFEAHLRSLVHSIDHITDEYSVEKYMNKLIDIVKITGPDPDKIAIEFTSADMQPGERLARFIHSYDTKYEKDIREIWEKHCFPLVW